VQAITLPMQTAKFFDKIFEKAIHNCVLLMGENGIIISVNAAFTAAFGYNTEDLAGKRADVIFLPEDRANNKPAIELESALETGIAEDTNFLLHKNGNAIWVTGESYLCDGGDGRYIVKLIHNIHTQKVLEHLLTDANELVDKVFDITSHTPLILFDSELHIIKANSAFCHLFTLAPETLSGKKLSETENKFLSDRSLSTALRAAAIKGESISDKRFSFIDGGGVEVKLCITAKNIFDRNDADRKTLMIVKVVSE
jgi:PAS domain S-box-containing protein